MRGGLRARMLAASALLALIVGGAFALLIASVVDLRDSSRLAEHSGTVLAASNRLERLVLDLETGARAYVITRRPNFLQPWRAALRTFPAHADALEQLVRDNPEQERRARGIAAAGRSYIADFSIPLVDTVRRHGISAGAAIVTTGEGKRRVDAIRARFDRFDSTELRLEDVRDARARANGRRALLLGAIALGGLLLLILLFAGYLERVIVNPVRAVAAAAGRLARGDLSARVPAGGSAEIAELGSTFNAMAASLEESRDELESQNAELEVQTSELEDQRERLAAANDELEAQQTELERALSELAAEKARIEAFYDFGERLAEKTDEDRLAALALQALGDLVGAELGALYLRESDEAETFRCAAVRGLGHGLLGHRLRPGEGLAGRALAERKAVSASYGDAGLRLTVFGEKVAVGHELDVPLQHADRSLGVVVLARVRDRPFADDERELIEHLAGQASVALSNSLAFQRAVRLVNINRAVLDATLDGIRLVDLEGQTLLANATIERLTTEVFGLPSGSTLYERSVIAERLTDPESYLATMETIAAHPDRETLDEFELADSGRSFTRYTAPVRDSSGNLIGRIIVVREVTAEREAEQLKSDLMATVSHELRTPLTGVLGFAELLLTQKPDAATRRSYLETIHAEARRLTHLIDGFLDLQRIEAGRFTLAIEPVELGPLLVREAELYAAQSAEHVLELDLPDDPLVVAADPDRVAQVVGNLLSNAIKYSPGGGAVKVAAAKVNGMVRVSVSDSGLGIPLAAQRQVFTKFFRVDSSDTRRIGGTGLGLALCREIVESHGGRIGFESGEGQGSTFWFELPVGRPGELGTVGPKALVVEDDRAAAAVLAESLAVAGCSVEVVATGEEALEAAANDPPALVCLDIVLPGALDGWQVLAALKAQPTTAHVPVIVCTGRNGRERAGALGASDFLTKPFSRAQLRDAVERLLPTGRATVLVVDDDPSVRRLVVETLSRAGLTLREAGDGEAALAALAERKPDAIVLDLSMPKLDGFGVLERLQANPETRLIPVVVLTAQRLSVEQRSALSARAVSLLEKSSYSADELRRLIERALAQ